MADLGEALLQASGELRYYQGRNEQAMVHAAVGYARMKDRLQAFSCTSSIGPGATNMVPGAALATVNRIPVVLLLPGDVFATRAAGPLLQELEDPRTLDASVNDCLRPVSRYFDRIWRPEQLPAALLQAMRVLTDPAETGAVTIALPRDTAAEACDWPDELFDGRVWRIPRPRPEPQALADAAHAIRHSRRPLLVAGGGVHYSNATELVTAVQEGVKLVVVLVQNHGFASIGALSRSVGAQGFGTSYRYRDQRSGRLDGGFLPVDLAANAASLGASVLRAGSVGELREALAAARAADRTTVIHVETDPAVPSPDFAGLVGRACGRGVGAGDCARCQGRLRGRQGFAAPAAAPSTSR